MTKQPHILVFDSGAGGLSVTREILQRVPSCQLYYAADNAYFPYGAMDDEHLLARVNEYMAQLYQQTSPDVIVVACNTASTVALDSLRERFTVPFVGVVPAIKPAAQMTQTRAIGILATPATVNRRYTHNLIEDFASDCEVFLYGSATLAGLAEDLLSGKEVDRRLVAHELDRLLARHGADRIDTVVLACTHFPLLKPLLNELTATREREICWVDSGEAIARRVAHLLKHELEPNQNEHSCRQQNISFLFSKPDAFNHELERRYLDYLG